MLPATVWMFPVWPVSVAARAGERTPTPVPAAIRPATTVTRPRRAGTARRRFSDCWNIVLLLGFEEFLPGAPRTPVPANGRAEARDPDGGELAGQEEPDGGEEDREKEGDPVGPDGGLVR